MRKSLTAGGALVALGIVLWQGLDRPAPLPAPAPAPLSAPPPAAQTATRPASAAPDGDYLLLALSWTPSWCAVEGAARGAARCAPGADAGWLVHGLWPQHEQGGWPEFCDTAHSGPSRAQTAAMVDIMGSGGLAAHQWRKHGSCSAQDPASYFAATRAAFAAIDWPETLIALDRPRQLAPEALLAAFRATNPAIGPDMAIVTCRDGLAQEIRICLTADLTPRRCDASVLARGCRAGSLTLPALP
ncbi:MAG: ribonuclease T2 family protein [Roseinatronobacter sp.]